MTLNRKLILLILNMTSIYVISGGVIAAHYFYRHHASPHGDMFGTRGSFLLGGVFGVALCVSSIAFAAYHILTSKDTFKNTFFYSQLAGILSGLAAAIAILIIGHRFTIYNSLAVTMSLTLLPACLKIYFGRAL